MENNESSSKPVKKVRKKKTPEEKEILKTTEIRSVKSTLNSILNPKYDFLKPILDDIIWNTLFKGIKPKKGEYKFDHTIITNGYSVSLRYIKEDIYINNIGKYT